jgi:hypothetical protein
MVLVRLFMQFFFFVSPLCLLTVALAAPKKSYPTINWESNEQVKGFLDRLETLFAKLVAELQQCFLQTQGKEPWPLPSLQQAELLNDLSEVFDSVRKDSQVAFNERDRALLQQFKALILQNLEMDRVFLVRLRAWVTLMSMFEKEVQSYYPRLITHKFEEPQLQTAKRQVEQLNEIWANRNCFYPDIEMQEVYEKLRFRKEKIALSPYHFMQKDIQFVQLLIDRVDRFKNEYQQLFEKKPSHVWKGFMEICQLGEYVLHGQYRLELHNTGRFSEMLYPFAKVFTKDGPEGSLSVYSQTLFGKTFNISFCGARNSILLHQWVLKQKSSTEVGSLWSTNSLTYVESMPFHVQENLAKAAVARIQEEVRQAVRKQAKIEFKKKTNEQLKQIMREEIAALQSVKSMQATRALERNQAAGSRSFQQVGASQVGKNEGENFSSADAPRLPDGRDSPDRLGLSGQESRDELLYLHDILEGRSELDTMEVYEDLMPYEEIDFESLRGVDLPDPLQPKVRKESANHRKAAIARKKEKLPDVSEVRLKKKQTPTGEVKPRYLNLTLRGLDTLEKLLAPGYPNFVTNREFIQFIDELQHINVGSERFFRSLEHHKSERNFNEGFSCTFKASSPKPGFESIGHLFVHFAHGKDSNRMIPPEYAKEFSAFLRELGITCFDVLVIRRSHQEKQEID